MNLNTPTFKQPNFPFGYWLLNPEAKGGQTIKPFVCVTNSLGFEP